MSINGKTFTRKKKNSVHFKPSSGKSLPKNAGALLYTRPDEPDRESLTDTVFETKHEIEILKAENKAAGIKEPAAMPSISK